MAVLPILIGGSKFPGFTREIPSPAAVLAGKSASDWSISAPKHAAQPHIVDNLWYTISYRFPGSIVLQKVLYSNFGIFSRPLLLLETRM